MFELNLTAKTNYYYVTNKKIKRNNVKFLKEVNLRWELKKHYIIEKKSVSLQYEDA